VWRKIFDLNDVYFSVEGAEQKQTACYDIDVEVDDTLKTQMNNFLLSTTSQQEIQVRTLHALFYII
jgi:SWI/SNF-related matrix-associated actin-dependent regulator of chromatin subfamily D